MAGTIEAGVLRERHRRWSRRPALCYEVLEALGSA